MHKKNAFLLLCPYIHVKLIIFFISLFLNCCIKSMEENSLTASDAWKIDNCVFKQLYHQPFYPFFGSFYKIFIGETDNNTLKIIALPPTEPHKLFTKTATLNNENSHSNILDIKTSFMAEPKKNYYYDKNKSFTYYCPYVSENRKQVNIFEYRQIGTSDANKPLSELTIYEPKNIHEHDTPVINIFSFSHSYHKQTSFRSQKEASEKYDSIGVLSSSAYPSLKRTVFYFEQYKGLGISHATKVTDSQSGYIALAVHQNTLLYCKEDGYPTGLFQGITRWRRYKKRLKDEPFQATIYKSNIVKNDHSFYPLSQGTALINIPMSYDHVPLAVLDKEYAVIISKNTTQKTGSLYCIDHKNKTTLFTLNVPKNIDPIISPLYLITDYLIPYIILFTKNEIYYVPINQQYQLNKKYPPQFKEKKYLHPYFSSEEETTACAYNEEEKAFYVARKNKSSQDSTIVTLSVSEILGS